MQKYYLFWKWKESQLPSCHKVCYKYAWLATCGCYKVTQSNPGKPDMLSVPETENYPAKCWGACAAIVCCRRTKVNKCATRVMYIHLHIWELFLIQNSAGMANKNTPEAKMVTRAQLSYSDRIVAS